jgi:hypothetical protein
MDRREAPPVAAGLWTAVMDLSGRERCRQLNNASCAPSRPFLLREVLGHAVQTAGTEAFFVVSILLHHGVLWPKTIATVACAGKGDPRSTRTAWAAPMPGNGLFLGVKVAVVEVLDSTCVHRPDDVSLTNANKCAILSFGRNRQQSRRRGLHLKWSGRTWLRRRRQTTMRKAIAAALKERSQDQVNACRLLRPSFGPLPIATGSPVACPRPARFRPTSAQ